MRRLRRQVGCLAADRPGPRHAGRRRPVAARRPGAVRRRRHLPGGARRGAGQHHRLLPAARRPSGRLRRDRRGQRVQRRVRDGWPGRRSPSTSPRSPSTSHARRSSPSSTPPRPWSPRPAAPIAGGHTIRNPEPIFGLAVQGVVHPDRVFRKGGARPGDVLVLSQADRHRRSRSPAAPTTDKAAAIAGMRRLNRAASEAAAGARRVRCTPSPTSPATAWPGTAGRWPSAATCRWSSSTDGIVAATRARASAAERGVRTGGDPRNREYVAAHLAARPASAAGEALCMDPQTSGGLLAAVDPAVAATRSTTVVARVGERGRRRRPRSCCAELLDGRPRTDPASIEQELWAAATTSIVGIDEVGRGAWAGPLMVGAAVLPRDKRVNGVRDSKMLTEAERERLFDRIAGVVRRLGGRRAPARRSATSWAWPRRSGWRRGGPSTGSACTPDAAVVDGKWNFVAPHVPHVEMRVKADLHCLSVAAASILAKVTRDRIMREHAAALPALELRHEQGLPVPAAQGRAAGLRPVGHPSPHVGVHGQLRAVAGVPDVFRRAASDDQGRCSERSRASSVHHDVIVIGAGLAGLRCATDLVAAGPRGGRARGADPGRGPGVEPPLRRRPVVRARRRVRRRWRTPRCWRWPRAGPGS